jgi:VanZ family protein
VNRVATIGWASVTVVVSVTYLVLGLRPTMPEALHCLPDYVVHSGAYFVLAFAAAITARVWAMPRPFVTGACYSAFHGGFLEVLQRYFPPRTAELSDFVADVVGTTAGAALAGLLARGRR